MIPVTLTPEECELVRWAAARRQQRAMEAGRKNKHGSKGGVDDHEQGLAAEVAFAKGMGVYPVSLGLLYEEDDDIYGVQVRGRRQHSYELYLWKRDKEDAPYVLVTGTMPSFAIRGFMLGGEAKCEKYFKAKARPFPRTDCYVVPQSDLQPPETLRWFLIDRICLPQQQAAV